MGRPMREKFQFNEKKVLIALFFLVIVVMGVLSAFSSGETLTEKSNGTYTKLAPDTSTEDHIRYIDSE